MAAKNKPRRATKPYLRTRPNSKVRRRRSKLLSIEASMEITGLGASLTRRLVKDGTIPSLRIGCRQWIMRDKLMAWLKGELAA